MDSDGEDYYDYSDIDIDIDDDEDIDDVVDTSSDRYLPQQKAYTILSEEVIQQRQEEANAEVSAVLSVSRDSAYMLLRRYNWNVIEVNEAWFDDEEKVCEALGILKKTDIISLKAKRLECGICFDTYKRKRKKIKTIGCGHPFCIGCWTTYISISINDGPGCLSLRCPHPSCGVTVGESMVNILVSSEDKKKYDRYLLRSYIEGNKKTKWCPAPGCDFAVEFDLGSGNYDVSCDCSNYFCWNCMEEAHRPVGCETVSKWILKNSAESENSNWILANSKPCPKCKRPIEKNNGCMHMTCSDPCKFEFCWLCLGNWSEHGDKTGGFYACNRYEAAKQQGAFDEAERRREMAKNSLERYIHYYERWTANELSRKKALADLNEMRNIHLASLRAKFDQLEAQVMFIIEAWQQIVECRRVLKWTYAYGYYVPEEEKAKRRFFEYLQGEAEAGLERLHQCAETELQTFLGKETSKEAFDDFRSKLAGLTSVTRSYFDNLVKALENGLSDVDDAKYIIDESTRIRPVSLGESSKGKKASKGKWSCSHCTTINVKKAKSCEMCSKPRS